MTRSELIVQGNGTLIVTHGDGQERILRAVRCCAQLKSVVAGSYLYELSPTALWGAAARGKSASEVLAELDTLASAPLPAPFAARIADLMTRYGALTLRESDGHLRLHATDLTLLARLGLDASGNGSAPILRTDVGRLKLRAARLGWPIVDCVMDDSAAQPAIAVTTMLRDYQSDAVRAALKARNGVVLLPCGAGKTAVGAAVIGATGGPALVVVPSRAVGEQWRATLARFTSMHASQIGWSSATANGHAVTLATYHGATGTAALGDLISRRWRVVVFDEVQSLPADMFRLAAGIQAEYRLGLTATLVREDGREREVAALVGPPVYDLSWSELEQAGWIAPVRCRELRVPFAEHAAERTRYKIAALQRILALHPNEPTLVAGTDLASLRAAARQLGFPVLTGDSSTALRNEMLARFRSGHIPVLGISRIGSVGIDLPNARVMIQLSGTFGSRQEEAQRVGRLLRPGEGKTAHFYTIVVSDTREVVYAAKRQRFLVNQGYEYTIVNAAELPRVPRAS